MHPGMHGYTNFDFLYCFHGILTKFASTKPMWTNMDKTVKGLEPEKGSNPLIYLARQEGFEPPTHGLEGRFA